MSEGTPGGRVVTVHPGPAADAGLRPGDTIVSVGGVPLRDVLDWWWLTERGDVGIAVVRDGRTRELRVSREGAIPLGVEFADVVFDGVRQCENACSFCFISGLPAGLRPSLYVRDDDYRLSFLAGNFITLTNLDEADRARIVEQRLSPLHVSVHAVDPDVRAGLVCPTVEDRALEHLDTLLANRIEVHVQIVLVPRVNDGAVLERTLAYLAERDGVLSVGCVPMGFTAHQRRWRASFDAPQARAVLAVVNAWQTRMRAERGIGWVYASDEFHLLTGTPMPGADAYDDFCQFENGIGMVAAFADELPEAPDDAERPITLVTGTMFAPVLERLMRERGWRGIRVLAVENALFGGNVGVAGLLGGADIAAAVAGDGWTGRYLVPDVVVNSDGLLLDDVRASTLAAEANADVRFIGSDALSLAAALLDG